MFLIKKKKKSCNSCQKLSHLFCGKRSCIRLLIPSWAVVGKTYLGYSVVISVQSADCGHPTEVLEVNFYSVFFFFMDIPHTPVLMADTAVCTIGLDVLRMFHTSSSCEGVSTIRMVMVG